MSDTEEAPQMPTQGSSPATVKLGGGAGGSKLSAEELRQKRRDKILSNTSSRMGKILGTEPIGSGKSGPSNSTNSKSVMSNDPAQEVFSGDNIFVETEVDDGVTIIRRKGATVKKAGAEEDVPPETSTSTNKFTSEGSKNPIPRQRFSGGGDADADPPSTATTPAAPPFLGFMVQQPDGSIIHPKLSLAVCRTLVFLLGIFLSIFNAKYFLVTFFSWEVAVFSINGLPVESPSNSIILLIALLGVKEQQLNRIKLMLKIFDCVFTDFSILVVSVLLSRVLYENFMALYNSK